MLQNRLRKPLATLPIGLGFVSLAALLRRFLVPGPTLTADGIDVLIGLAYGLGIGVLLLGLVARRRP